MRADLCYYKRTLSRNHSKLVRYRCDCRCCSGVHVYKETASDYAIRDDEHYALKPIGLPRLRDETNEYDRNQQSGRLERVEIEREGRVDAPRDHHGEWHYEQRDLSGRAHSDAKRELHLVLGSKDNGGRVLGSIPHDRDDNGSEKEFRYCKPAIDALTQSPTQTQNTKHPKQRIRIQNTRYTQSPVSTAHSAAAPRIASTIYSERYAMKTVITASQKTAPQAPKMRSSSSSSSPSVSSSPSKR
mmetsp:Transcript_37477/g.84973  ORF Transcript_37477/g.84973 Transcript_37477/m.84973 type:complete len:243 (+) Transcript_37477:660-1388(+)